MDLGDGSSGSKASDMAHFAISTRDLEILTFLVEGIKVPIKYYLFHYGYALLLGHKPIIEYLESRKIYTEEQKRASMDMDDNTPFEEDEKALEVELERFFVECKGKTDSSAFAVAFRENFSIHVMEYLHSEVQCPLTDGAIFEAVQRGDLITFAIFSDLEEFDPAPPTSARELAQELGFDEFALYLEVLTRDRRARDYDIFERLKTNTPLPPV
jgi:hypothetical protein